MSDDLQIPDELTVLKDRAAQLGIKHSNNITVETLRAKISAKLEGAPDVVETAPESGGERRLSQAEKDVILRKHMRDEYLRLRRLRFQNMNPQKKELHGEIITVANEYIGKISHYIPYGEASEEGWYVPQIIYQYMRDKKFLQIKVTKVNGREKINYSDLREFSIEELPDLTVRELKELAAAQASAGLFTSD